MDGGGTLLCAPHFSHKETSLHSHSLTDHRGDKAVVRTGSAAASRDTVWGSVGAPASLIPKEIQDGSTYIRPGGGGRTLPL